jgi:copper chaperone
MKQEIKIEGMTCNHCAMSITNEIATIEGVKSVVVNHESGSAIVESENVDQAALTAAIEEAGYKALEFEQING